MISLAKLPKVCDQLHAEQTAQIPFHFSVMKQFNKLLTINLYLKEHSVGF